MSEVTDFVERAAKNIGCEVSVLESRMNSVLNENEAEWEAAGRNTEDRQLMALRVATRLIRMDGERARRSGCTLYEGMFLTAPRYKDWGALAYNKMKNTLTGLNEEGRNNLVKQGAITVFTHDEDGTWTKHYNPSLARRESFTEGYDTTTLSEPPSEAISLDDNTSYYLVWDKNNVTFPNGGSNFRYGIARPQKELQRDCLFLGRPQGSKDDASITTIRLNGTLAEEQYPTYVPGTIAVRPGKNNKAYGKAGITTFVVNSDLASVFDGPPVDLTGDTATGTIPTHASAWLGGLNDLGGYFTEHKDDSDWWDQWIGFAGEVIHIDPRENGGYIVTVGDLDLSSPEPPIDIYVPQGQESLVDFGVGSVLAVVGAPWQTREGDTRLSVYGWWCIDAIQPIDVGGWDE